MRKYFFFLVIALLTFGLLEAQQKQPSAGTKPAAGAPARHFSPAAARMQQKLDFLNKNAASNPVSHRPTELEENEVNAWIAEGGLKLPTGVRQVVFHGQSGTVRADSRVDFDQITAGKHSYNPLLMLFSGTHDINVTADCDAQNGTGHVHVQSASIDGVDVPRMALELFVDKYLKPKYPNIGMDTDFKMPDRIDTATVGNHVVVLTQK